MCYMTTTITVYTALSSILPSIISFSIPIPNAPIVIGDHFPFRSIGLHESL